MKVTQESLWLLSALIIIAVLIILAVMLMSVGGPEVWFDALKGFFALLATYIISQMALLLRP